ncbi:Reverse transcriptase domain-containing protein [Abeliophyllum distichum]|uniref:Reverse transcriptase domain-containing protein n=1 Tax=Abeliophyllum distichum TaxID=126358 RepID=A0ABD1U090_9LAMI
MEKYDGSSDPIDHLMAFVDLMRLRANPDAIMCRAFPPTLRREAKDWVATLLPKSIHKEKGKEAEYRQQPPPRAGVINVIVGGIAIGGDSNSARKNYARGNRSTSLNKNERFSQNITFNDEDLKGVTCPRDDALVIVADIVDFYVKRVLVDNGSAVDVMSWEVFLGLKISPSKIKHVTTPLHSMGLEEPPLYQMEQLSCQLL